MNARGIGAGQQLDALTQGDQVLAQDRFQLAGVSEGELPQQGSDRRGRVHATEEGLHATGAHHVEVVDAVGAGAHAGDHRGQLRCRVGRPGLDPRFARYGIFSANSAAARSGRPASSPAPARRTTRDARHRTPPTSAAKLCDTCTGSAFLSWSDCCVGTPIIPAQRALSSFRHPMTINTRRWIEAKGLSPRGREHG